MGGLENFQTAKKYYAAAIQLTGGKNIRALYGVCLVQYLNSFFFFSFFYSYELMKPQHVISTLMEKGG